MTQPGNVALPERVLALDTSTERMSLALGPAGGPVWAEHESAGGARASAELIPQLLQLLQQVGLRVSDLDAIAFGCGPGAFTGLRTACAVVQGLAWAARPGGLPVIPVPTLLAVADEACLAHPLPPGRMLLATLDARMDELYVAPCRMTPSGRPEVCGPVGLCPPEALPEPPPGGWALLAGNALDVYAARLPAAWAHIPRVPAWPRSRAVLRLCGDLWAQGAYTDAAGAQPLYVRDKVALTTAEREALRPTSSPCPPPAQP